MKAPEQVVNELVAQFGDPRAALMYLVEQACHAAVSHVTFPPERVEYGRVWVDNELFEIQLCLVSKYSDFINPGGAAVSAGATPHVLLNQTLPFHFGFNWYRRDGEEMRGPYRDEVAASNPHATTEPVTPRRFFAGKLREDVG